MFTGGVDAVRSVNAVVAYAKVGLVLAAVMMAMVGIAAAVERVRRQMTALARDMADARSILEQVQYDLWDKPYCDDPTLVRAARDIDAADRILWHRVSAADWWANRLYWRWWYDQVKWNLPWILVRLHLRKSEPWFIENEEGELVYND